MCLQTRLLWKPADWEFFGNHGNYQVSLLLAIPEIKAENVGKENVTPGSLPSQLFSCRHDLSPAIKET